MTHDSEKKLENRIVRYRNRDIYFSDIKFIQETINKHWELGRKKISKILCEAWNWRTPMGGLKDYPCRDLLLRLEEWGHIKLPPRMCGNGAGQKSVKGLSLPITPHPIESGDINDLIVKPIEKNERLGWRILMENFHYLGDKMIVGEHILYGAYLNGEIVSCIAWGAAALRCPKRDEYIGWDFEQKRHRLNYIVNNQRFLILPYVKLKNLGSKILSMNLKRLNSDWEEKYGHPVYFAETFVDGARFRGTVYQASNWKYLGETSGKGKKGNSYKVHGQPKSIYIYSLHKRALSKIREKPDESTSSSTCS